MKDNQALIKNLARKLQKIAVYNVCSVWNDRDLNKTNVLQTEKSTINSVFRNVCSVWDDTENLQSTAIQTIQTLNKQNNICGPLDDKPEEIAVFQAKEVHQTIQTAQTCEEGNIYQERVIQEKEVLLIPSDYTNLSFYGDLYQERAAILQYDAGYSKQEAEHWAKRETFQQYVQQAHTVIWDQFEMLIINDHSN